MTDLINEYFGVRGVRLISWVAVVFIAYAFLAAYAAISLAPATFWVDANAGMGVPDIQRAYAHHVRPGLVDHRRIHPRVPRRPAHRRHYLPSHPASDGRAVRVVRATASTAVSQLLDSFIVLYIAFVIGPQHWSMPQFLAVGTVNYGYKMCRRIALIPLLYVARPALRDIWGAGRPTVFAVRRPVTELREAGCRMAWRQR